MESIRSGRLFTWASFVTLCGPWVLWRIFIIIQRLFFHPLSSFPGPKIAGASTVYRMYYSIWKDGEMFGRTQELHKRYGIPRISCNNINSLIFDWFGAGRAHRTCQSKWSNISLQLLINTCTGTNLLQLHFSNPEVYHKIYACGSKFIKDPDFYAMFAQDNAIFGIISPAVHKLRKDLLSPLFSRRAVLGIEPLVQSKVGTSY